MFDELSKVEDLTFTECETDLPGVMKVACNKDCRGIVQMLRLHHPEYAFIDGADFYTFKYRKVGEIELAYRRAKEWVRQRLGVGCYEYNYGFVTHCDDSKMFDDIEADCYAYTQMYEADDVDIRAEWLVREQLVYVIVI